MCLLQQRAPGGDVLHPHRGRRFEAQCLRMLDHQLRGHVGQLAIGAPARDVQRRYHADRIACSEAAHRTADGFDHAGRFVAQPAGELRFLQIGAVAEHHLGAVQADRLDPDLDFVGGGGGNVDIVDAQHIDGAIFVDADNLAHGGLRERADEGAGERVSATVRVVCNQNKG